MEYLIAGLVIFLGVHSTAIVAPRWRERMLGKLGEGGWKGLYSAIAVIGLDDVFDGFPRMGLLRLLERARHTLRRNSRWQARRNIAAHYDLGNDLFAGFLDRRMQYSCAIFPPGQSDPEHLELAQELKLRRICEKLKLGPADHLLEIGTGWGGLAEFAAAEYGCRVTTTTISREQHLHAGRRIRRAGLEGRVELLLEDYRDLEGRFDKLVSVEMIEAVGWQYLDTYLNKCADLIKPGGRMLLQAITLPDRLYEVEKDSRSFANTQVFPGGCLFSEQAILDAAHRHTDLGLIGLERIGRHYAPTLAAWQQRFQGAWQDLSDRYDERFRRLWEFYLTYCEAGFLEGRIDDVQMLMQRPGPPARPGSEPFAKRVKRRRSARQRGELGHRAEAVITEGMRRTEEVEHQRLSQG